MSKWPEPRDVAIGRYREREAKRERVKAAAVRDRYVAKVAAAAGVDEVLASRAAAEIHESSEAP